jgi:hypothetical protein
VGGDYQAKIVLITRDDKLQSLSALEINVYTAGEYEADANGNYHWKLWEWKY